MSELDPKRIMGSAHAMCPTDMPHWDRMEWMANYFMENVARSTPKHGEAALRAALNAMLTQFGMDEDEWSKPTFDQARAALESIPLVPTTVKRGHLGSTPWGDIDDSGGE